MLSRNRCANPDQPGSPLEEKIYALATGDSFLIQVKEEQDLDPVISVVKRCINRNEAITKGRLKRVQNQLLVDSNGVLKKSGGS